ncbi:MAG: PDZ domain-containing protein [Planctomycetes bacterium]|nr:PDZ domain-containing protein [Planctomycetota bacterium]
MLSKLTILFVFSALLQAQVTPPDTEPLSWRSLGPANMEGRVTDFAVVESRPSTFFVAAATGGVWRTKNAGTTFEPVFERGGTASIGSVAVAPSNPSVVWIGTGEGNARNSVTYGDGVYLSTDGGDHFIKMGLEATRQVARIVIHPTDPNTVYFAALGSHFGPNSERGLFRTRDGGKNFEHILALDADTGCVDVVLAPDNPEVVYAAAYQVRRDGFDTNDPAVKFGAKAGIYKSVDGGANWTRLSGGLPTAACGRIGLAVQKKSPATLWAVVETEYTGKSPPPIVKSDESASAWMGVTIDDVESGVKLIAVIAKGPADVAGLKADDFITHMDGVALADQAAFQTALKERRPGASVKLGYKRKDAAVEVDLVLAARPPEKAAGDLGGQTENKQDAQGPNGFECGGVFRSDDSGEHWTRINSVTPRPFYYSQIRVDPEDAQRLWVLGTSLYWSEDGGKSFKNNGAPRVHVDHHALWIDPADGRHMLLGNDGGVCVTWDRGKNWEFESTLPIGQFYALALDNRTPYRIYGGLQDNGSWCIPSRSRSSAGVGTDQVCRIGGGDGFVCAVDPEDDDSVYSESQNGALQRVNVRTGETFSVRRPAFPGVPEERPAAEGPARSSAEGEQSAEETPQSGRWRFNWKTPFILSPWNHATLLWAGQRVIRSVDRGQSATVISPDICLTDRGSGTAIAESPAKQGVLWVGSDDGAVHVSRDDGVTWKAVQGNLTLPGPRWVAHIEVSRTAAGKAWVVFDGHRNNDLAPYVFVTEDYGTTWRSLAAGLPQASTRVLREDPKNSKLLYVGTEIGVYFSCDSGEHWAKLGSGLPTVPVHDLAIHPRERELVAATHGRALWMVDVSALQDWRAGDEEKDLVVFVPRRAVAWNGAVGNGRMGKRRFHAQGPERGAAIWMSLSAESGPADVRVKSIEGEVLLETKVEAGAGFKRVLWNMQSKGGGKVPPGHYRVSVETKASLIEASLEVIADPQTTNPAEVILP